MNAVSPDPLRVLVAGCGDVGSRLGLLLSARGHRVWGLRRRPEALPEGIEPLAADLTDPATLAHLPAALDLVFYTAAAGGRSEAAYRRTYVEGIENLLAALERRGERPQRIFFTSSTGVYAQSDGEWVDETSPTEPESFTGSTVLAGERLLAASPWPATALRLGGIYGPGRTRLLDRVAAGEAECRAEPPEWTNRIHADDAAAALAHLAGLGEPDAVYVGVDSEPAERCTVLAWLAERIGAPPPRILPPEAAEADAGRPGSGPRRRSNKRCSNRRLLATGFELRHPGFREGYAEMIAERG